MTLGVLGIVLGACAGDDTSTTTETTTETTTVTTDPSASSEAESAPATVLTSTSAPSPATTLSSAPTRVAPPTSSGAPATTAPSYDFAAVGPIVESFVAERGLNGAGLVIVDREDGVVHEQYWGEFAADRVSLVASSSKMLTAGVLLRLADDGLLDMDAPVADVVPWGTGNPDITPAQLVSNSSGLVGLLDDTGYGPYICQFVQSGTMQSCAEQVFTTPDDDADISPPDTRFRYGGAQWQVAGAVAEVASGRSWAELIEETYVVPCGVDSLGYNNHFAQLSGEAFTYPDGFGGTGPSVLAATDNPNMEGGAYIDPPDYAELLLMHLRGGRCGDTQVLTDAAVDRMHADRIGQTFDGETFTGSG